MGNKTYQTLLGLPLPEVPFSLELSPYALKQRAAKLEGLVHAESQHHEGDEDGAQVFSAQPVVVFEVVSLVLKGVESLVFDAPARPADAHRGDGVFPADADVRDPGKPEKPLGVHLPIFEQVHPKVGMGLIEGKIFDEAEEVEGFGLVSRCVLKFHGPALGDGLVSLFEEEGMIAGFNRKDEAAVEALEGSNVGSVGTEGIFGHDELDMGVVASQDLDTTAGGVAFAVVFGVAVFSSDHFVSKGDHGLASVWTRAAPII